MNEKKRIGNNNNNTNDEKIKTQRNENCMHANAEWVLYFVGYFWLLYNVHVSSFTYTHSSQCTIWLYVSFVSFFSSHPSHVRLLCLYSVSCVVGSWTFCIFAFRCFDFFCCRIFIRIHKFFFSFVRVSASHNFVRTFLSGLGSESKKCIQGSRSHK